MILSSSKCYITENLFTPTLSVLIIWLTVQNVNTLLNQKPFNHKSHQVLFHSDSNFCVPRDFGSKIISLQSKSRICFFYEDNVYLWHKQVLSLLKDSVSIGLVIVNCNTNLHVYMCSLYLSLFHGPWVSLKLCWRLLLWLIYICMFCHLLLSSAACTWSSGMLTCHTR